jgi:hypothetical protein
VLYAFNSRSSQTVIHMNEDELPTDIWVGWW